MAEQPGQGGAPDFLYPLDEAWLARHGEAALEPALPIIDPHHHLWDNPGSRYLLPELLGDLDGGHAVQATVFVQCRAMYRAAGDRDLAPLGETEFVNGVAAMSASGAYGPARACAGIVGYADLSLGARVEPILEAHLSAAGVRFRGIRNSSARDADETIRTLPFAPPADLLRRPAFREGFARLAPLGLSFDAWLLHPQIPELADLARAFPQTTVILDHVGGPIGVGRYAGRRQEVFAAWRRSIVDLAGCPNVQVKLGGLGMPVMGFGFHERETPPTSAELAAAWRPYVETCIEAFGVGRCMFESNFPVDKVSCGYAVLWNAFKRLAQGGSPAEKAALFGGTARRVYRLDLD